MWRRYGGGGDEKGGGEGERPATSWPRVSLRDTEVRDCMNFLAWSGHPFASGPMATQTEGVSVLSGVKTS